MTTRRAIDILIRDLGTKGDAETSPVSTPEETVVVLVSGLQILATAVDAVQERLDALDGPHDTVGLLDLQSEIHELTTKVSKLAKTTKKVAKKK